MKASRFPLLSLWAAVGAAGVVGPTPASAQSVRLRWYDSPIDGQSQPYAVVPPRGGDGGPYGLVLALHGHDGGPGGYCALTLGGNAPPSDLVIVCPYGFGNTAFRGVGEEDAFEVISRVVDEFPIDPERIYVTGASDGGVAAYELALHHPDLFAAAMPLAAYGGQTLFPNIGREGHRWWEKRVIALHDMTAWAENAMTTPFYIANGGQDFWTPLPEETVAAHLKRLGYSVENVIHDDLAHDSWTRTYRDGAALAWLRSKRRSLTDAPARVVFTTSDPRYRSSHWVSGLELEAPIETFGRVEAVADPATSSLSVTTAGLLGLTLAPPSTLFDTDSVVVTLDGREFPPASPANLAAGRSYHRDSQGGAWLEGLLLPPPPPSRPPTSATPARTLVKRPGLSGPLTDFRSKPTLFVYGTIGSPDQARALLRIATDERDHWTKGIRLSVPVLPDHAITDADRAGRTLVLFGGGNMNRLASDVEATTPLKTFKDGAAVELGKELYPGPSTGYRFIHPSPWSPNQYVVIVGGTDVDGVRLASLLPELQPDFIVAGPESRPRSRSSSPARRGMVLGPDRKVLAAGFFDRHWRLPKELRRQAPVPAAPAPAEPAPAPVEPAVAPVEPAVAPVEPDPAPVEPDPAPVEPDEAWPEAAPIQ